MENSNFAIEVANLLLAAGMLTRHPDANPSSRRQAHTCQETRRKRGSSDCWAQAARITSPEPNPSCLKMLRNAAGSSGQWSQCFKSDCHWCIALATSHIYVVHICSPRAIWVPSELWMLHKSESNAGKHFILSFMSILSSARGQWGGRGVEEAIGFYFCHVCRGAEMKDRMKGSKQVNHCSCFKKKYLGSCLQGPGLSPEGMWENPKISRHRSNMGRAAHSDLKALMTFADFPLFGAVYFRSSCQLTSCTAWWTEVRLLKLLSCEAQSTLDPLWAWSSTYLKRSG